MKYLAFEKSVAVQAAAFICNYAIAQNAKLTVEHVAPHVVELPEVIDDAQKAIIDAVAEKFGGYLTDEIPSPVNFYDPLPRTRRPAKERTEYDFTTRGEFGRHVDRKQRIAA